MNYFDLVNAAIEESGTDLDGLSLSDFTSPPEKMQSRFKRWVKDAWRNIQMKREGWSFMSGRANGVLRPRIYVEQGSLTAVPVTGELYEGARNGALFSVVQVSTISGDWLLGDAKAYIDISNFTGDLEIGEGFNRVSGTPVSNAFTVAGRGRYDLTEYAADFDDLEYQSMYLTDVTDGSDYTQPLKFVEWNLWNNYQEAVMNAQSRPVIYTQTPDGLFDFFPALDTNYNVYFNYGRKPQILTEATDIPNLPSEFHDAIVWTAVESYGRYDEKPSVVRQAQEELRLFNQLMEKKFLPKVGWAPNIYSENGW
jgi:hypothetical protein